MRKVDDTTNQLNVLILLDNFSPELASLTNKKPWGFNRFHTFRFIDLCLEWIVWLESPNVIVAIANQLESEADELQHRWSTYIKNLKVLNLPDCYSANDLLREIQNRGLITDDFLLVHNCATFCSSNLAIQIENFKIKKRKNKNMVAALLYTEEKRTELIEDEEENEKMTTILGYETTTQKLVHYCPAEDSHEKLNVSKRDFLAETTFRTDLSPTGLWLCTLEFAGHFAGNHDFGNLDQILQDILSNEEFLCQQIHLDIIQDAKVLTISNFPSLFDVHRQLLQRKCFPLTMDNVLPNSKDFEPLILQCKQRNLYAPKNSPMNATNLNASKMTDVVFGQNCRCEPSTSMSGVSLGLSGIIGENAHISNVICGENVRIGDGARLDCIFIGENVTIGEDATLNKYCFIGDGVEIPSGAKYECSILMKGKPPVKLKTSTQAKSVRRSSDDDDENETNEEEDSEEEDGKKGEVEPLDVIYQGNSRAFVAEVSESMQAVVEANLSKTDIDGDAEKLKLEINASKMAYNIGMDELPQLIFLAFLSLPQFDQRLATFKELFSHFSSLWSIYYKKAASRVAMLQAIEEFATTNEQFRRLVPNIAHWLNQDKEMIGDEQIIAWYSSLGAESPLRKIPKLTNFIEWLQEEDDEDDEEEIEDRRRIQD